ncbi:MAG: hypothetical protein IPM23_03660 [Candidatus Melainabacteria bacterium]|nr:hypothetical protein [Candidatus Melainabacteria bacterium]
MDPSIIILLLKALSYVIVLGTVFITMKFVVPAITRSGVTFTGNFFSSAAAIVLIFFAGSLLTKLFVIALIKLAPAAILYLSASPWLLIVVSVLINALAVLAVGKALPRVLFVRSFLVAITAAVFIGLASIVGSLAAMTLIAGILSIGA